MDIDAKMQKNAIFSKTKRFRAMVSMTIYRKSAPCDIFLKVRRIEIHLLTYLLTYMGFTKNPLLDPLKFKMAEIRHLENRHDVIFSAEGGPIWIMTCRLR